MISKPHSFLRAVVRLCLVMMSFLTLSVALLAWHSGEQLDSTTVGVLMGGWCGELLMTLLKRRFDIQDKLWEEKKKEEETDGSLGDDREHLDGPDYLHSAGD